MDPNAILLAVAMFAGLYMAWNIGANDVANAMGTSVGSGAISYRKAIFIAGICEFLGAMLVGSHVTETVRKGIVDPMVFQADPHIFAMGMIAALIGAAAWLNLASTFGLPVSTTHSIVGAVFGFGLVYGGWGAVKWTKLAFIAGSWVVSPLSGGIIAFIVFSMVNKYLFRGDSPVKNTLIMAPLMAGLLAMIISLSVFYKGLAKLYLDLPFVQAFLLAAGVSAIVGFSTRLYLAHRWKGMRGQDLEKQIGQVDRVFAVMQVATASYVAFAHGANDVANAVGPMAGAYATIIDHAVALKAPVPTFILAMGAGGIVIGLATYGARVMSTIGGKITEITPSRGFSAEFACATTVLICSRLGLPISTTHVLVGSVIGVGIARGVSSLDRKVIMKIGFSWLIEIPLAATITILAFQLLKLL